MPNKNININLSDSDIRAIVCALPLVTYVRTDLPEQAMRNELCCNSAAHKLLNRILLLHANEWRVSLLPLAALRWMSSQAATFLT